MEAAAAARAALAAKRAAAKATPAPDTLALVLAPAPAPCGQDAKLDLALLRSCHEGSSGAFGAPFLQSLVPQLVNYDPSDTQLGTIVDHFGRIEVHTVGSALSRVRSLGMESTKKFTTTLCRLAPATLLGDHSAFRYLEKALRKSSLELMVYVEASSYDETPMQTRASEVLYKTSAPRVSGSDEVAHATSAIIPRIKREVVVADTCPSKILQTRSAISMLVKQKATAGEEDSYFLFAGAPLTAVQLIHRDQQRGGDEGCSPDEHLRVEECQRLRLGRQGLQHRQACIEP